MKNRRSGLVVMKNMIGLVGDLKIYMFIAAFIGTLGHLCASFVTIFAGYGLLANINNDGKNIFFIKLIKL